MRYSGSSFSIRYPRQSWRMIFSSSVNIDGMSGRTVTSAPASTEKYFSYTSWPLSSHTSSAIKPLSLPKDWDLPNASLSVKFKKISDKIFELIISTDFFARVVTIEPSGKLPSSPTDPAKLMEQCDVMIADDNYFDILAGESRTVLIRLRNSSCVDGFKVHAWNTESTTGVRC